MKHTRERRRTEILKRLERLRAAGERRGARRAAQAAARAREKRRRAEEIAQKARELRGESQGDGTAFVRTKLSLAALRLETERAKKTARQALGEARETVNLYTAARARRRAALRLLEERRREALRAEDRAEEEEGAAGRTGLAEEEDG